MRRLSLQSGIYPYPNAPSLSACPIETPQRQHYLVACTSAVFISADIFTQLGKAENLIEHLYFHLFYGVRIELLRKLEKCCFSTTVTLPDIILAVCLQQI
jgi:hypothetical protein